MLIAHFFIVSEKLLKSPLDPIYHTKDKDFY